MDIPFDDGRGNSDDVRDPQVDRTHGDDPTVSNATDTGDIGDLDAAWWESIATRDDDLREAATEVALDNDIRRLVDAAGRCWDDFNSERWLDCELAAMHFLVDFNLELFLAQEDHDGDQEFELDVYRTASVAAALANDLDRCEAALSRIREQSTRPLDAENHCLAAAVVFAEEGLTDDLLRMVQRFSDPDHALDIEATLAAISAAFTDPEKFSFHAGLIANQGLVQNVECSVVEARVETLVGRGETSISSLVETLDEALADKAMLRYTRSVARSHGAGALAQAVEGVDKFSEILAFELGYGSGLGGHQLPSDIDAQLGDPLLAVALYQGAVLGRQRVLNELRRQRAAREE